LLQRLPGLGEEPFDGLVVGSQGRAGEERGNQGEEKQPTAARWVAHGRDLRDR
jgi:hypothetical protein